MLKKELNKILKLHKLWLKRDSKGIRADLSGADLSYAKLSGANLSHADLSGANLFYANLYDSDLSNTNLSGANLSYANLYYADLFRAKYDVTKLSKFSICPEGDIIGWKKINHHIIKLLIRKDVKRV